MILEKVGHSCESTSVTESNNGSSAEINLDASVLDSSPPDGTELRQANALLTRNINGASDLTPRTKRYTSRMVRGLRRHTEMVTIVQERNAQRQWLEARKKRKTGKRVMLQNKFVFSTPEEILNITMEAESTSGKKKRRAKVKDTVKATEILSDDDVYIEDSEMESEGSVIVVARPVRP